MLFLLHALDVALVALLIKLIFSLLGSCLALFSTLHLEFLHAISKLSLEPLVMLVQLKQSSILFNLLSDFDLDLGHHVDQGLVDAMNRLLG